MINHLYLLLSNVKSKMGILVMPRMGKGCFTTARPSPYMPEPNVQIAVPTINHKKMTVSSLVVMITGTGW